MGRHFAGIARVHDLVGPDRPDLRAQIRDDILTLASFLVKHLLIHWREGARWFWDTLVDADLAKESAKLQALQTKQQLGVQALGIANQTPQLVLSLFRS